MCRAINITLASEASECHDCTWVKETNYKCYRGSNGHTYFDFEDITKSNKGVVEICKARAKYMRKVIQWFDTEININKLKSNKKMIIKKSNVNKVKVGDSWSRVSNGKVTRITSQGLFIENEEGQKWEISFPIVEDEFYFHDQFIEEVKVTRTELSQIFINHPRMIMTACYHKQVKEKDLNEEFFKLYANKGEVIISEKDYIKKVKELTKVALKGEQRIIIGRHESVIDDFGRIRFIDVNAEWNKEKDYDTRQRLVDPRTLKYAIIANVKYTVK